VSASIYLEGGGESKELQIRCREGFRKLLENCAFVRRMPRLTACGSRTATFADFKTELAAKSKFTYLAMLIDSEEPLENLDETWRHLRCHDNWERPAGVSDDQVLFMTTCMETWIVADRSALADHFKNSLQHSALPALNELENRPRQEIQQKLIHATRNCPNAYAKGKRSFEVLSKLSPQELEKHLPSFRRAMQILRKVL